MLTATAQIKDNKLSGKVLLAEDSRYNQRLISLYISQLGADVMTANNGKEAVEMALSENFDLVLMDMQMPVMDGVEAMIALRKAGCATPIIALTANAMSQDKESCLAAGCTDFLTKPIDKKVFSNTLKKHMKKADESRKPDQAYQQADESDQEQFDIMVDQFISGLPAWIIDTNAAVTSQDWTVTGSQIHDLKGMGGSFGYPELTISARNIENLLHQSQYEQALEALEPLIRSLETIITQHKHQSSVEQIPTSA